MFRKNKIKVAIIGATGFTGLDLVYLLSKHSQVEILNLCLSQMKYKHIVKFYDVLEEKGINKY